MKYILGLILLTSDAFAAENNVFNCTVLDRTGAESQTTQIELLPGEANAREIILADEVTRVFLNNYENTQLIDVSDLPESRRIAHVSFVGSHGSLMLDNPKVNVICDQKK